MDKLIPLNKGIHRQPSVGADGELSELVNLIPQNGELVNVRGMEEIADGIEGEIISMHKVDESTHIFTIDSSHIRIYKDYILHEEYEVRESRGAITAMVIGNTVVVSGIGTEYKYFLYTGGRYHFFQLSQFIINTTIDTSLVDHTKQGGCNSGETQEDAIRKLLVEDEVFAGVTFGIIGLKSYTDDYFFFSDVFVLDSSCSGNGYYISGRSDSFVTSIMRYTIKFSHNIPDDLLVLVKSVDLFLTPSTFFREEAGSNKLKDAKGMVTEILDSNFRLSVSTMLEKGKKEYTIYPKRVSEGEENLVLSEGQAKIMLGELFSYNSRLHVFSGKEYMPVHIGRFSSNLISSNNKDGYGGRTPVGPYQYPIDSYKKNGGVYEYSTQMVDSIIHVDIEDELSGELKTLAWSGKIQYPLSPVFSVPTIHAKKITIYVDLSGVELIEKEEEGNDKYSKKVYGKITYELYPSERYGLSMCINYKAPYEFQSGYGDLHYFFEGGICYSQPYDIMVKVPEGAQTITSYEYREIDGEKVVGTEGWSFMNRNSWNQIYGNGKKPYNDCLGTSRELRYGEAANPFVWSALNVLSIGEGEILNVSTSAKALSEGQYGKFPLYVFCTDGIWALEVNGDGTYKITNPTSRDVCNNPDSITQIDGAVVFTTDQGLMMIQGSEVVNLSGAMEGYNVDESIYFPEGFFAGCGKGEFDHIVVSEKRDFREILKTCTIAYDYVNQLLRIFPKREDENNSTHPYKYYVYSFTTREFASVVGSEFEVKDGESVTYNEVKTVVPDYPSSIVQIGDALYRPAERDDNENTKKGLLLTRPITLDEPFALKKLHDMRLHYSKFDGKSKCHVVVYASNDGTNWAPIRSLRKRSYKYYRFAIITDMKDMDALSGMVLRYEVERNNKLR